MTAVPLVLVVVRLEDPVDAPKVPALVEASGLVVPTEGGIFPAEIEWQRGCPPDIA